MKQPYIFIAIILSLFTLLPLAMAQEDTETTPEATPTIAAEETSEQIENLKDRIATKVAEMSESEKQAVSGTVVEVSVSTITIETATNQIRLELVDGIQVVQEIKGKRTELDIETVAEDDYITVFGELDTTLDLLHPKLIVIQDSPQLTLSGVVTEVDKENFTITLQTHVGAQEKTLDYERSTTTSQWDSAKGAAKKAGFTQLTEGDIIHVMGRVSQDDDARLSAIRILDLGALTGAKSNGDEATDATPTPTETEEEETP